MNSLSTTEEKVLSITNLSKRYEEAGHKVHALKHTSLHLKQGEFLAIMGTSGSGKSTFLNLVGALDSPNEGTIALNGRVHPDMFKEPYATQYRSENIGFIFQSYNLLKDLSVEENIALPLILKNIPVKEMKARVAEMVGLVGLSDWRKHRPVQLSGGQQQRVAIARALITKPPIILADEPTGNLDFNTTTEVLRVLGQMKEQLGQSIILVTHDPYVATFADRVLFFHDGQIAAEYICRKDEQDMDRILSRFRAIMGRAQ
ncbi:ABC transporter ATP-binding protein [Paenibacillus sambharensis]|uniref:ABC transporter ATP-binding protein n=1 Tax=Paenibacillus sambharensis TaxID=1803190 RepID=A0A2W1LT41_9BACL|nr:ABC transporter ATP-binding protein [Paenibacillus sambharensis]PZD97684.1 ABC transporter ATP-binding protein [Paenibacillus sambharensis]